MVNIIDGPWIEKVKDRRLSSKHQVRLSAPLVLIFLVYLFVVCPVWVFWGRTVSVWKSVGKEWIHLNMADGQKSKVQTTYWYLFRGAVYCTEVNKVSFTLSCCGLCDYTDDSALRNRFMVLIAKTSGWLQVYHQSDYRHTICPGGQPELSPVDFFRAANVCLRLNSGSVASPSFLSLTRSRSSLF